MKGSKINMKMEYFFPFLTDIRPSSENVNVCAIFFLYSCGTSIQFMDCVH